MTPLDLATRHARIQNALERCGQSHLLTYWAELTADQRLELLDDLERINFAEVPNLARQARGEAAESHAGGSLEPATVLARETASRTAVETGRRLLAEGKVAALTVAGGQGTRLGFAGPKGAFPISPIKDKTLFQLFAESILAAGRRSGRPVPWYIMTSPSNDAATRDFFEAHRHFGLAAGQIRFFEQGVMPAFGRDGRILLDEKHRVALSPDGHGGSLLAMATRGVLADMAARGVEVISYFQVDNPLVHCIDPLFLGLHVETQAEMSGKTLPKADDLERVGNFVMQDGKLTIVEYSDFPESLARARNPDGSRRFDAANIAIHALSRTFVERLTADPSRFALPWHRAEKKVPFVDPATGRRVEPEKPNAVKLESFVFDALPLARRTMLLATSRGEEFSPVKNAEGVDSVATARRDLSRRAAHWLESAGLRIPRGTDGDPTGLYEISPLAALEAAHAREIVNKVTPAAIGSGRCYVE